jgi:hypothetical protein
MGGSRHPGRLKILEILKHNSSNLPSKVRQPISIVLNLRGILQAPTSEQYRLRNTSRRSRTLQLSLQSQSTYQASPRFNQTRCPDFQLLRHQVFHKHSTASLASNHFYETRVSGLRRDQKEKQFDTDAESQFQPLALRPPPIEAFRRRHMGLGAGELRPLPDALFSHARRNRISSLHDARNRTKQSLLDLAPRTLRTVTVARTGRDNHSGRALTGQSKQMTAQLVRSLPVRPDPDGSPVSQS